MTAQHRAARWYASRLGWPVHPLRPRSKEPATAHGWHDATVDLAVIDTWWRRWPEANIGLALALAGAVALDVDPRNRGDRAAVESAHGPLPDTPVAITGRRDGGVHVLCRRPTGVPATKGDLMPGVEVLGTGYIVLAPSIHPDTVLPYAWDVTAHPRDVPLAEAPAWVVAPLVARPKRDLGPPTGPVAECLLGRAFRAAGWFVRAIDDTRAAVLCPWRGDHSTGRDGDSSTVLFAPTTQDRVGAFYCAHAHCAGRTVQDVLRFLPRAALATAEAALGRTDRRPTARRVPRTIRVA